MEHLSAHKLMSEPGARISLEDYEVVHVCYDGRADDRRPDVTVGFRHSSTRAITYLRFTGVLFDDYHGMSTFFTLGDSHIMNTEDRQWEARAKIEVSGYRVNHWWAESVEDVDSIASPAAAHSHFAQEADLEVGRWFLEPSQLHYDCRIAGSHLLPYRTHSLKGFRSGDKE